MVASCQLLRRAALWVALLALCTVGQPTNIRVKYGPQKGPVVTDSVLVDRDGNFVTLELVQAATGGIMVASVGQIDGTEEFTWCSVQMEANPSGATLSGTTTIPTTRVNGELQAIFTDLSLDRGGAVFTLRFSCHDRWTAVSSSFDIFETFPVQRGADDIAQLAASASVNADGEVRGGVVADGGLHTMGADGSAVGYRFDKLWSSLTRGRIIRRCGLELTTDTATKKPGMVIRAVKSGNAPEWDGENVSSLEFVSMSIQWERAEENWPGNFARRSGPDIKLLCGDAVASVEWELGSAIALVVTKSTKVGIAGTASAMSFESAEAEAKANPYPNGKREPQRMPQDLAPALIVTPGGLAAECSGGFVWECTDSGMRRVDSNLYSNETLFSLPAQGDVTATPVHPFVQLAVPDPSVPSQQVVVASYDVEPTYGDDRVVEGDLWNQQTEPATGVPGRCDCSSPTIRLSDLTVVEMGQPGSGVFQLSLSVAFASLDPAYHAAALSSWTYEIDGKYINRMDDASLSAAVTSPLRSGLHMVRVTGYPTGASRVPQQARELVQSTVVMMQASGVTKWSESQFYMCDTGADVGTPNCLASQGYKYDNADPTSKRNLFRSGYGHQQSGTDFVEPKFITPCDRLSFLTGRDDWHIKVTLSSGGLVAGTNVVDHFKPKDKSLSYCDVILSNSNHLWSPDPALGGASWVDPGSGEKGLGGSSENWPRDHGPAGDDRQYLSHWLSHVTVADATQSPPFVTPEQGATDGDWGCCSVVKNAYSQQALARHYPSVAPGGGGSGGWRLARHLPVGSTNWFPVTDDAAFSEAFGTFEDSLTSSQAFGRSVTEDYTEVMFATVLADSYTVCPADNCASGFVPSVARSLQTSDGGCGAQNKNVVCWHSDVQQQCCGTTLPVSAANVPLAWMVMSKEDVAKTVAWGGVNSIQASHVDSAIHTKLMANRGASNPEDPLLSVYPDDPYTATSFHCAADACASGWVTTASGGCGAQNKVLDCWHSDGLQECCADLTKGCLYAENSYAGGVTPYLAMGINVFVRRAVDTEDGHLFHTYAANGLTTTVEVIFDQHMEVAVPSCDFNDGVCGWTTGSSPFMWWSGRSFGSGSAWGSGPTSGHIIAANTSHVGKELEIPVSAGITAGTEMCFLNTNGGVNGKYNPEFCNKYDDSETGKVCRGNTGLLSNACPVLAESAGKWWNNEKNPVSGAGENYMLVQNYQNSGNDPAVLVSPSFEPKGGVLKFWYHCRSDLQSTATLYVQIEVDGTTQWETLPTPSGAVVCELEGHYGTQWRPASVSLSSFTSGMAKVRFVATAPTPGSESSDIAVDSISYLPDPFLSKPDPEVVVTDAAFISIPDKPRCTSITLKGDAVVFTAAHVNASVYIQYDLASGGKYKIGLTAASPPQLFDVRWAEGLNMSVVASAIADAGLTVVSVVEQSRGTVVLSGDLGLSFENPMPFNMRVSSPLNVAWDMEGFGGHVAIRLWDPTGADIKHVFEAENIPNTGSYTIEPSSMESGGTTIDPYRTYQVRVWTVDRQDYIGGSDDWKCQTPENSAGDFDQVDSPCWRKICPLPPADCLTGATLRFVCMNERCNPAEDVLMKTGLKDRLCHATADVLVTDFGLPSSEKEGNARTHDDVSAAIFIKGEVATGANVTFNVQVKLGSNTTSPVRWGLFKGWSFTVDGAMEPTAKYAVASADMAEAAAGIWGASLTGLADGSHTIVARLHGVQIGKHRIIASTAMFSDSENDTSVNQLSVTVSFFVGTAWSVEQPFFIGSVKRGQDISGDFEVPGGGTPTKVRLTVLSSTRVWKLWRLQMGDATLVENLQNGRLPTWDWDSYTVTMSETPAATTSVEFTLQAAHLRHPLNSFLAQHSATINVTSAAAAAGDGRGTTSCNGPLVGLTNGPCFIWTQCAAKYGDACVIRTFPGESASVHIGEPPVLSPAGVSSGNISCVAKFTTSTTCDYVNFPGCNPTPGSTDGIKCYVASARSGITNYCDLDQGGDGCDPSRVTIGQGHTSAELRRRPMQLPDWQPGDLWEAYFEAQGHALAAPSELIDVQLNGVKLPAMNNQPVGVVHTRTKLLTGKDVDIRMSLMAANSEREHHMHLLAARFHKLRGVLSFNYTVRMPGSYFLWLNAQAGCDRTTLPFRKMGELPIAKWVWDTPDVPDPLSLSPDGLRCASSHMDPFTPSSEGILWSSTAVSEASRQSGTIPFTFDPYYPSGDELVELKPTGLPSYFQMKKTGISTYTGYTADTLEACQARCENYNDAGFGRTRDITPRNADGRHALILGAVGAVCRDPAVCKAAAYTLPAGELDFAALDGSDAVPLQPLSISGNAPRTVSFRLRTPTNAPQRRQCVLGMGGSGGGSEVSLQSFNIETGANGQHIGIGGAGMPAVPTSGRAAAVNDGEWHHIVVTWDGSEARVYVDSVLDNVIAGPGAALDTLDTAHFVGKPAYATRLPFTAQLGQSTCLGSCAAAGGTCVTGSGGNEFFSGSKCSLIPVPAYTVVTGGTACSASVEGTLDAQVPPGSITSVTLSSAQVAMAANDWVELKEPGVADDATLVHAVATDGVLCGGGPASTAACAAGQGAAAFDGDAVYSRVVAPDPDIASKDFSVQMYIKRTSNAQMHVLTQGSSQALLDVYFDATGRAVVGWGTDGNDKAVSAASYASDDVGKWVHYSAVVNHGGARAIYRNGLVAALGSGGTPTGSYAGTGSLYLGANNLVPTSTYTLTVITSSCASADTTDELSAEFEVGGVYTTIQTVFWSTSVGATETTTVSFAGYPTNVRLTLAGNDGFAFHQVSLDSVVLASATNASECSDSQWLDGDDPNSAIVSSRTFAVPASLAISDKYHFVGAMDEFRLFSGRGLTASEVSTNWHKQAVAGSNLVMSFLFDAPANLGSDSAVVGTSHLLQLTSVTSASTVLNFVPITITRAIPVTSKVTKVCELAGSGFVVLKEDDLLEDSATGGTVARGTLLGSDSQQTTTRYFVKWSAGIFADSGSNILHATVVHPDSAIACGHCTVPDSALNAATCSSGGTCVAEAVAVAPLVGTLKDLHVYDHVREAAWTTSGTVVGVGPTPASPYTTGSGGLITASFAGSCAVAAAENGTTADAAAAGVQTAGMCLVAGTMLDTTNDIQFYGAKMLGHERIESGRISTPTGITGNSARTIALRVRFNTTAADGYTNNDAVLVGLGDPVTDKAAFNIQMGSNGRHVGIGGLGMPPIPNVGLAPVINDGMWHHIVVTWDGSEARVYVDSVLDNVIAGPGAPLETTDGPGQQFLGKAKDATTQLFNGWLGDYQVFDTSNNVGWRMSASQQPQWSIQLSASSAAALPSRALLGDGTGGALQGLRLQDSSNSSKHFHVHSIDYFSLKDAATGTHSLVVTPNAPGVLYDDARIAEFNAMFPAGSDVVIKYDHFTPPGLALSVAGDWTCEAYPHAASGLKCSADISSPAVSVDTGTTADDASMVFWSGPDAVSLDDFSITGVTSNPDLVAIPNAAASQFGRDRSVYLEVKVAAVDADNRRLALLALGTVDSPLKGLSVTLRSGKVTMFVPSTTNVAVNELTFAASKEESTVSLADGDWHQILITYSALNSAEGASSRVLRLYVDRALELTATLTNTGLHTVCPSESYGAECNYLGSTRNDKQCPLSTKCVWPSGTEDCCLVGSMRNVRLFGGFGAVRTDAMTLEMTADAVTSTNAPKQSKIRLGNSSTNHEDVESVLFWSGPQAANTEDTPLCSLPGCVTTNRRISVVPIAAVGRTRESYATLLSHKFPASTSLSGQPFLGEGTCMGVTYRDPPTAYLDAVNDTICLGLDVNGQQILTDDFKLTTSDLSPWGQLTVEFIFPNLKACKARCSLLPTCMGVSWLPDARAGQVNCVPVMDAWRGINGTQGSGCKMRHNASDPSPEGQKCVHGWQCIQRERHNCMPSISSAAVGGAAGGSAVVPTPGEPGWGCHQRGSHVPANLYYNSVAGSSADDPNTLTRCTITKGCGGLQWQPCTDEPVVFGFKDSATGYAKKQPFPFNHVLHVRGVANYGYLSQLKIHAVELSMGRRHRPPADASGLGGGFPGYCLDTGACSPCPAGFYRAPASPNTCSMCVSGKSSAIRSSMCGRCQAGQISVPGMACQSCKLGQTSESGDLNCADCRGGKFAVQLPSSATCYDCIPGMYANQTASMECTDCELGKYADKPSTPDCKACEQGLYGDQPKSEVCSECPAYQYSDVPGMTSCKFCQYGTINNGTSNGKVCDSLPGFVQTKYKYGPDWMPGACVNKELAEAGVDERLCQEGIWKNQTLFMRCYPLSACDEGVCMKGYNFPRCAHCSPPFLNKTCLKWNTTAAATGGSTLLGSFTHTLMSFVGLGATEKEDPLALTTDAARRRLLGKGGGGGAMSGGRADVGGDSSDNMGGGGAQQGDTGETVGGGIVGIDPERPALVDPRANDDQCIEWDNGTWIEGYYRINGRCKQCPPNDTLYSAWIWLLMGLVAMGVAIFYVGHTLSSAINLGIAMTFFQEMALIASFTDAWNEDILSVLDAISAVSFNLENFQFACYGDFSYQFKWSLEVSVPLYIWVYVTLLWLVVYGISRITGRYEPYRINDEEQEDARKIKLREMKNSMLDRALMSETARLECCAMMNMYFSRIQDAPKFRPNWRIRKSTDQFRHNVEPYEVATQLLKHAGFEDAGTHFILQSRLDPDSPIAPDMKLLDEVMSVVGACNMDDSGLELAEMIFGVEPDDDNHGACACITRPFTEMWELISIWTPNERLRYGASLVTCCVTDPDQWTGEFMKVRMDEAVYLQDYDRYYPSFRALEKDWHEDEDGWRAAPQTSRQKCCKRFMVCLSCLTCGCAGTVCCKKPTHKFKQVEKEDVANEESDAAKDDKDEDEQFDVVVDDSDKGFDEQAEDEPENDSPAMASATGIIGSVEGEETGHSKGPVTDGDVVAELQQAEGDGDKVMSAVNDPVAGDNELPVISSASGSTTVKGEGKGQGKGQGKGSGKGGNTPGDTPRLSPKQGSPAADAKLKTMHAMQQMEMSHRSGVSNFTELSNDSHDTAESSMMRAMLQAEAGAHRCTGYQRSGVLSSKCKVCGARSKEACINGQNEADAEDERAKARTGKRSRGSGRNPGLLGLGMNNLELGKLTWTGPTPMRWTYGMTTKRLTQYRNGLCQFSLILYMNAYPYVIRKLIEPMDCVVRADGSETTYADDRLYCTSLFEISTFSVHCYVAFGLLVIWALGFPWVVYKIIREHLSHNVLPETPEWCGFLTSAYEPGFEPTEFLMVVKKMGLALTLSAQTSLPIFQAVISFLLLMLSLVACLLWGPYLYDYQDLLFTVSLMVEMMALIFVSTLLTGVLDDPKRAAEMPFKKSDVHQGTWWVLVFWAVIMILSIFYNVIMDLKKSVSKWWQRIQAELASQAMNNATTDSLRADARDLAQKMFDKQSVIFVDVWIWDPMTPKALIVMFVEVMTHIRETAIVDGSVMLDDDDTASNAQRGAALRSANRSANCCIRFLSLLNSSLKACSRAAGRVETCSINLGQFTLLRIQEFLEDADDDLLENYRVIFHQLSAYRRHHAEDYLSEADHRALEDQAALSGKNVGKLSAKAKAKLVQKDHDQLAASREAMLSGKHVPRKVKAQLQAQQKAQLQIERDAGTKDVETHLAPVAIRRGALPYDGSKRLNMNIVSPHSTYAYMQSLDSTTALGELFRVNAFMRLFFLREGLDVWLTYAEGVMSRENDISSSFTARRTARLIVIQRTKKSMTGVQNRI